MPVRTDRWRPCPEGVGNSAPDHVVPRPRRLTNQSVDRVPMDAALEPLALAPRDRRPPTRTVISGGDAEEVGAVDEGVLGREAVVRPVVIAKPSASARATEKDSTSVCSWSSRRGPGRGPSLPIPAALAACSTPTLPARTTRSKEMLSPAAALEGVDTTPKAPASVTTAQDRWARWMRPPLGAARLVAAAEDEAAHAVLTSCCTVSPSPRWPAWRAAMPAPDAPRSLAESGPASSSPAGPRRRRIASAVPCRGELEPGAGEGVRELVGVLHEAARSLAGRVHPHRYVGRRHHRRLGELPAGVGHRC